MKDDTLRLIGSILPEGTQRDAVHIAVAPAKCGPKWLNPGQEVQVINGYAWPNNKWDDNYGQKASAGIVDPYLTDSVEQGQSFFVFLFPGSITSLRHEWAHPQFDKVETTFANEHEVWLRKFADSMGLSFSKLMSVADDFILYGEYHVFRGIDTPDYDAEAFWKHWSAFTEQPAPKDKHFFSCSC